MAQLKLVGVVRVSGSGQAARDTPEIQRRAIRKIADDYGADLVDVVEFAITVSDLTLDPKWMTRVAPRIKDPNTHVAVYHQDRLARPLDWGQDLLALNALHSTGTNIYTPDGIRDLSTEEGRMMVTMQNLISGGERARIIKRTRSGLRRWSGDGSAVAPDHCLPTGITCDRKLARERKDGRQSWGYTEDIVKVKTAFRMLLDGVSYVDIAKAVGMTPTPVRAWFQNDLYRGLYRSAWQPEGSDPIRVYGGPGQPEQVIEDTVWRAAQAEVEARRNRHSKPRHSTEPHTLYSGRIYSVYPQLDQRGRFELPSTRMHLLYGHLIYGRQKQTAYVCRCIHQGWEKKCGARTWQPVERLHVALDAFLATVTSEDQFVDYVLAQFQDRGDGDTVEAERASLSDQVQRLERKLQVAYDDRLDGVTSLDDYKRVKVNLGGQLDQLTARLADLEVPAPPNEADVRREARRLAFSPDWSIEKKRRWLARYNVKIAVANDGISGASLRLFVNQEEDDIWFTDEGDLVIDSSGRAVPIYLWFEGAKWEAIVGYDIGDTWAVLEATQGLHKTSRAAEILGVKYEQLRHLARSGQVPLDNKRGRVQLWTRDDIERARELLEG